MAALNRPNQPTARVSSGRHNMRSTTQSERVTDGLPLVTHTPILSDGDPETKREEIRQ